MSFKDMCKEAYEKIDSDLESLQNAYILPKKWIGEGSFRFVDYDTKRVNVNIFRYIWKRP